MFLIADVTTYVEQPFCSSEPIPNKQPNKFSSSNHLSRFSKLSDPASDRRQQLEDSLRLQQFCRDVEDELQWIKERKSLADSNDYGKSLLGVQNLQKKHQVCSMTGSSLKSECSGSLYNTTCDQRQS